MDTAPDRPHESEMDVEKASHAMISVESTTEWKIHDILYDGTERYLKPLTFSDHVAKLSRKVDWQKFVGTKSSLEDPQAEIDDDEADFEKGAKKARTESLGPWENVAKNLHQSLIEMNVLLDVIQIAKDGNYLYLDAVDSTDGTSLAESNKMQLGGIFMFKKNIMSQGQRIFETMHERLAKVKETNAQSKEANFLNELIELRQAWRLKKLGNSTLGDLSYQTYGSKFKPNATFEVKKNVFLSPDHEPSTSGSTSKIQTAIDIVLPKDLEQTARLKIVVQSRSNCHAKIFDHTSNATIFEESTGFYSKSTAKPWQNKLENAQRTLLCRDLFSQLSKEAVHLHNMSCTVKGDCITVNLSHDDLLKIFLLIGPDAENVHQPFDRVVAPSAVSFSLEHAAFDAFCRDLLTVAAPLPPLLSNGALTFGTRRQRTAGCDARSSAQLRVEQRVDRLLLQRLVARATHGALVTRCREALSNFATECRDPMVVVHWSGAECTDDFSMATIFIYTPLYESCQKMLVLLEIDSDTISTILKDGEAMKFGSNADQLVFYIDILTRQHQISALGVLSRHLTWHPLFCSLTRVNLSGQIEPTIFIGNSYGNKSICVKFSPNQDPEILVQNEPKLARAEMDTKNSILTSQLWEHIRRESRQVNFKLMTGRCFLQKLELLICALS